MLNQYFTHHLHLLSCFSCLLFTTPIYAAPKTIYSQSLDTPPLLAQTFTSDPVVQEMLIEGMEKGIKEDYQGAIAIFSEVIRLYPTEAEGFYNRGIAYMMLHDYQTAIADFNQAISLAPNIASFYVDRALSFYKLGEREKALSDLQKATELFEKQGERDAQQQVLQIIKIIRTQ